MTQGSLKGRGSGVKGRGYQQLLAWQRAHELALAVFRSTSSLSRSNSWLRNQVARSAVSVAANIAEGYSRGSLKEYVQFLNIARGSLAETEYYILFLRDAEILPPESLDGLQSMAAEAARLLLGLIRSLRPPGSSGIREPTQVRDQPTEYAIPGPAPLTLDPADA